MQTTKNHKWFKVVSIKISFEHIDSWAKSLLFRTHHLWNSTTELILVNIASSCKDGRKWKISISRPYCFMAQYPLHQMLLCRDSEPLSKSKPLALSFLWQCYLTGSRNTFSFDYLISRQCPFYELFIKWMENNDL